MEWLEAAIRPVACGILKHGAVPRHVAFIMDGNRRYAEQRAISISQGHILGFERLLRSLGWCLDLGITCVSVYAFSVDNYRRGGEEVAALMALAESKMTELAGPDSELAARGVRVCVAGDLALAPPSLRAAAQRVMDATQHHTRAVLNICFSYTSSREMQQALAAAAVSGRPMDAHLYTAAWALPPVDLLVRTSGETRLSDFLTRQSAHALLVFTRVMWPDFGYLDFAAALLEYQRKQPALAAARAAAAAAAEAAAATAERSVGPLPRLKLLVEARGAGDSPCGVITPGSCSSPSSAASAEAEAEEGPPEEERGEEVAPLRRRRGRAQGGIEIDVAA